MPSPFTSLFETWAPVYDDTVTDLDGEYGEVFMGYWQILNRVANEVPLSTSGYVVDMGSGTGNLAHVVSLHGHQVIGADPVIAMLDKARNKFPELELVPGDFISFDYNQVPAIKAIVTSYAFHHLTDPEKEQALARMKAALSIGGTIVIADTIFQSWDAKEEAIKRAVTMGYPNLAHDLATEFYTTLPYFEDMCQRLELNLSYQRLNYYVWLIVLHIDTPILQV